MIFKMVQLNGCETCACDMAVLLISSKDVIINSRLTHVVGGQFTKIKIGGRKGSVQYIIRKTFLKSEIKGKLGRDP